MKAIEITSPGISTTVQDLGRLGHQGEGYLSSGVMDVDAYRLGNALVGNGIGDATIASLEYTLTGGKLKTTVATIVAVTGADAKVTVDGRPTDMNRPFLLPANAQLSIQDIRGDRFVYLSVAGGFQIPKVKGSRATATSVGIGGYHGRALKTGDRLAILDLDSVDFVRPSQPSEVSQTSAVPTEDQQPDYIRVLPGAERDWFSDQTWQTLLSSDFHLSKDINRMGYRLDGPKISGRTDNLLSEPNLNGTMQIDRDGKPIVLLADRATHGGYPVIAKVIAADLGRLAQWPLKKPLRFQEVDLATAWQLLAGQRASWDRVSQAGLWQALRPVRPIAARIGQLFD